MENLKNNEVEETTIDENQEENDNVEENEVDEVEESTEEAEEESADDDIYAEELDNLVSKADKADKLEKKISGDAYKYRRNKKEGSEADGDEDSPKYVTREEMLASEQRILKAQTDTIIESMSSSPSESKLIRWHLENSINPTGNVRNDVENAKVLANKRKMLQENILAKKSAQSANSKGKGTGVGQKKTVKTETAISPQDQKMIKMANMTWNAKTGRYEGNKTFYNPNAPEGQKTGRL